MSQRRSRVQKHAELREAIIQKSEEKIQTKELSTFASKLHQIDNQQFEEMEFTYEDENHSPLHLRDSLYKENAQVEHDKLNSLYESHSDELIEDTDSFKNDYLSEFIEEAKQYSVDKGYRVDHDTRSNLLRELKAQKLISDEESFDDQPLEDSGYLETLSDQDMTQETDSNEELEEHEETSNKTVDDLEDTIMSRVAELSQETMSYDDYYELTGNTDLFEKTTKLQVQLEEQDQVVQSMGTQLEKTNRAMNVLLTFLLILLLAIVAVVGYILLQVYEII